MKVNVPAVANTVVRCFLIFLVAYLWLSYLVNSWLLAILLAVCIAFAVNALIVFLLRRRSTAVKLTREQSEHMNKILLQLRFMKSSQVLELFKEALEKAFSYSCKQTARKLTVQTNERKIEIFSLFHKEPAVSDIIECLNTAGKSGIVYVAAQSFSPQVSLFVSALKTEIRLLSGATVYSEILAPAEIFPAVSVETKKSSRRTFAQIKKVMLSPERTKGYLITGIIIFATSFLVNFSLFYIIIASAVFALAIISRFGEQENTRLFQ